MKFSNVIIGEWCRVFSKKFSNIILGEGYRIFSEKFNTVRHLNNHYNKCVLMHTYTIS